MLIPLISYLFAAFVFFHMMHQYICSTASTTKNTLVLKQHKIIDFLWFWIPSHHVRINCFLMSRLLCLPQAQTALYLFPLLRLSGCSPVSNHQLSLQVGRPTRLWCTLVWCGWWEVTPSTTPTTTWSSSKLRFKICNGLSYFIHPGMGGKGYLPHAAKVSVVWLNKL